MICAAELETFFTVSEELKLFALSCLFGGALGVIFDVFRVFRIIVPHNTVLTAIEDILFFCVYGVFLMCFTLVFARGDFRFFYPVGNILGFCIYIFTVGTIVVGVFSRLAGAIKAVFRFIGHRIFMPVYKIFRLICEKSICIFVTNSKNK